MNQFSGLRARRSVGVCGAYFFFPGHHKMRIKRAGRTRRKSATTTIISIISSLGVLVVILCVGVSYGFLLRELYKYLRTHRHSGIAQGQLEILRRSREIDPNRQSFTEYRQRTLVILTLVLGYIVGILLVTGSLYCTIRPTDGLCREIPAALILGGLVTPSVLGYGLFRILLRYRDKSTPGFHILFAFLSIFLLPVFGFFVAISFFAFFLIVHGGRGP